MLVVVVAQLLNWPTTEELKFSTTLCGQLPHIITLISVETRSESETQPARSTASLSLQHLTKWTAAADFKRSGQLPNVVDRTAAVLSLITGDGNGNILVTQIRHLTEFESLTLQSQLNMWSCHETCKQKQEAMQEHTDDHV